MGELLWWKAHPVQSHYLGLRAETLIVTPLLSSTAVARALTWSCMCMWLRVHTYTLRDIQYRHYIIGCFSKELQRFLAPDVVRLKLRTITYFFMFCQNLIRILRLFFSYTSNTLSVVHSELQVGKGEMHREDIGITDSKGGLKRFCSICKQEIISTKM